jgi:hypothetical protein
METAQKLYPNFLENLRIRGTSCLDSTLVADLSKLGLTITFNGDTFDNTGCPIFGPPCQEVDDDLFDDDY